MPRPNLSKDTWKRRTETFFLETTFHGFRELGTSRSWWQKCLWIVIMTASVSCFVLQVRLQVYQYIDGVRSAKIATISDESYDLPLVHVTIRNWCWISTSKLRRYNISLEELQIAKSYLEPGMEFRSDLPVEEAKRRLKQKFQRMNVRSVREFFLLLSMDSFDGDDDQAKVSDKLIFRDKCYYTLNSSSPMKPDFSRSWKIIFQFNFTSYWQNVHDYMVFAEPLFNDTMDRHEVRHWYEPVLINGDTDQEVPIEQGKAYSINGDCRIHRHLTDCTSEFDSDKLYFRKSCLLDCELKVNQSFKTVSCFWFQPNSDSSQIRMELTDSFRNGDIPLCSFGVYVNGSPEAIQGTDVPVYRKLNQSKLEDRENQVRKCQSQCVHKCEQWMTTWSVHTYNIPRHKDTGLPDYARIQVTFPDVDSIFIIEETEQYSWHDMLSDVGGLLGLWLGASMMTMFQMIHICCWADTEVVIDRRVHSEKKKTSMQLGKTSVNIVELGPAKDTE